jgi:hypothetical protein
MDKMIALLSILSEMRAPSGDLDSSGWSLAKSEAYPAKSCYLHLTRTNDCRWLPLGYSREFF